MDVAIGSGKNMTETHEGNAVGRGGACGEYTAELYVAEYLLDIVYKVSDIFHYRVEIKSWIGESGDR